jgi:hypothetical protein
MSFQFNYSNKPDLRGIPKETVEEFLARGGEINGPPAMPIPVKKSEVLMDHSGEKKNCRACIFYQGQENEVQGECHFFPPIAGKGFASVSAQSWCSRFRTDLGNLSRQTEKFEEVKDADE